MEPFSHIFTDSYNPLKAGSIDGTDEYPHDRAVARAMAATYKPNKFVQGVPECTIFVSHLNPNSSEQTIKKSFKQFGKVINVKLVRDIVTSFSKCYCFLEFEEAYEARNAIRSGPKIVIDDHEVLVEAEYERSLKGWIPRRLGGGLGGKRESGQLRFGGRDRPFRRPILRLDVNKDKHLTENVKSYSGNRRLRNRDGSSSRDRRRSRSRSTERLKNRETSRKRDR